MNHEFHLRQGPNITGPFTLAELQRMLLQGEIQRDTPCRQGIAGHWLTVYDHVPSAHWGRSIMSMQAATAADEKPREKTRSRLPFLIISILCGLLALALLGFLLKNIAQPASPPSIGKAHGSEALGAFAALVECRASLCPARKAGGRPAKWL